MKLELNIENLLLIIFAGAFLIQLTYFMFFFIRMIFKQKAVVSSPVTNNRRRRPTLPPAYSTRKDKRRTKRPRSVGDIEADRRPAAKHCTDSFWTDTA